MDPVIVIAGLVFLVLAFIRRRNAANAYYEAPPANPGYGYGNTGPRAGPVRAAIRAAAVMAPLHSKAAAAAFWARWPVVRLRVRDLPQVRP
jgi:hypothetical protein